MPGPWLRLGYIVAPDPLLDARVVARRTAGTPPIMNQAVVADFIREGRFLRHVRRMRVLYSERERAALAWTDPVTFLHEGHVPDAVHEVERAQFDEKELANLTFALVAISGCNRLCVAFRVHAGDHQVSGKPVAVAT